MGTPGRWRARRRPTRADRRRWRARLFAEVGDLSADQVGGLLELGARPRSGLGELGGLLLGGRLGSDDLGAKRLRRSLNPELVGEEPAAVVGATQTRWSGRERHSGRIGGRSGRVEPDLLAIVAELDRDPVGRDRRLDLEDRPLERDIAAAPRSRPGVRPRSRGSRRPRRGRPCDRKSRCPLPTCPR